MIPLIYLMVALLTKTETHFDLILKTRIQQQKVLLNSTTELFLITRTP